MSFNLFQFIILYMVLTWGIFKQRATVIKYHGIKGILIMGTKVTSTMIKNPIVSLLECSHFVS